MINEEDRRELFRDLSEAAAVALSSKETPLASDDMKQVRRARNVIVRLADMLDNGFKPPFSLMLESIKAAFVIGKYCVVTPPVERFISLERTEHMRSKKARKKAQTPKEIALQAAIKAEYEATPVDLNHPYAAAETLVDGVNRRLEAAAKAENFDFKPIKGKALGDRLQKLQPEIGIDSGPRAEELTLEQRGALAARQLLGKK